MNNVLLTTRFETRNHADGEIRDRLTRRSLTLSKSLCILAAAIPLLAAVGWIFKIELLTKIHPALPAMQPNTALGLVLGAIAIIFTGDNRRSEKGRLVACAIAAVVSLLGLLTLGEYVFSWDLGIDRIFISGSAATAATALPGASLTSNSCKFCNPRRRFACLQFARSLDSHRSSVAHSWWARTPSLP